MTKLEQEISTAALQPERVVHLRSPRIIRQETDVHGAAGVEPAGREELYTTIPWLVNKQSDVKDNTVVSRVDWNLPEDLKSVIRIKASIPGILQVIDNGGTSVIATHFGRPKGQVNPKYSTGPLADILRRLLVEQGRGDILVNHLQGSVTEQGLKEGVEIVKGAINVLENTRFCPGDEKNDPVFARALASLGNIFNYAGFGAGERVHASTVGLAEYMQEILLDPLVIKEEQVIRGVLESLYGVIFGGGPKVSEKITTLKSIIGNMKEGGYVIIGTGPLPAFLKAMYNLDIGQKADDADIAAAKEIVEFGKSKNVRILLPSDFVAVMFAGNDISEQRAAAEDMLKSREMPAGAKIYHLALKDQTDGARVFVDKQTNALVSAQNLFIYDIDETSIAEFKQEFRNTPEDNTIFWNGPVGINEMAEFKAGSKEIAIALGEISKNDTRAKGPKAVTGGADTASVVEEAGVDEQLTFVSTGGGASLALLEGKELTAITELARLQSEIEFASARGINVLDLRQDLRDARSADIMVHKALPEGFDNLIAALKETKEDNYGVVVVGANAILNNAGAIATLKMLKGTGYEVVVWAQYEAQLDVLKLMGIEEVTKTLISYESSHESLEAVLSKYSKSGISTALIVSHLDAENIDLDNIKRSEVKVVSLQKPQAEETQLINSMPLAISRAVAGMTEDDYIINRHEALTLAYRDAGQVSAEDLAKLNGLISEMPQMPLISVNEEVAQAQIVYEETVAKI